MINPADMTGRSGAELAQLLAGGEVSSAALVDDALARADELDARLGLFITRLDTQARSAAREADALRRSGDARPLLGVPIAVKDLHPMVGVPLTMGSAAMAPLMPTADSGTIARLKAAGLIPIATSNTCEFGPACFTRTAAAGDARNPWDESASASGSSGGSAAAVAARVVPWAHASDGAGSIRLPAAVCGLVGHKPSRGVTPSPCPSFLALGVEGVLTRTVPDARIMFELLSGAETGALYPVVQNPPPAPHGPLRIAFCVDAGREIDVDPECVAAVRLVVALLEAQGHQVVEIANPVADADRASLARSLLDMMSVGIAATVSSIPDDRRSLLQPYTRWLGARGDSIGGVQLHAAQLGLAGVAARALVAQDGFDVVVTPTATRPQIAVDEFELDQAEKTYAAMLAWAAFTPIANCTGQPAISVPVATTAAGLPVGVQLQGRLGSDRLLLDVAEGLEEAAPWADRAPGLLATRQALPV